MEQCKLCLLQYERLEDSHYLPAGIYKSLRDESGQNPNPWHITDGASVQTSKQLTARLLCTNCEQRFSQNGENWVLRNFLKKDKSFPLADMLKNVPPDLSDNQTTTEIYLASKIPEINISALTYFAISIFWRGSIYPWATDGSVPVKLGPFQERFRQYLLGLESFPKHTALWLIVRTDIDKYGVTAPPYGGRNENMHIYKFPMPGLAFTLTVSKNIPIFHRSLCFVHGLGNPIIKTAFIDSVMADETAKLYQRSLEKLKARR